MTLLTAARSPSTAMPRGGDVARLAPPLVALVAGFLIVGLTIPVLPFHVHADLGLCAWLAGFVAGGQGAAALAARFWSGRFADSRGAKRAVVVGLAAAAVAGLVYLASLALADHPRWSLAVLVLGRALLGGGESFIVTGALAWALARSEVGARVIALAGTAMYAGVAMGAPIGTWLHARWGFAAIGLATVALPLMGLLVVAPCRATDGSRRAVRYSLAASRRDVRLASSTVAFGLTTALVALVFAARGWSPAWLAASAFAGALMFARIVLASRTGTWRIAPVALARRIVAMPRLALRGLVRGAAVALAGALFTGSAYALVYPGLGIEAIHCTKAAKAKPSPHVATAAPFLSSSKDA